MDKVMIADEVAELLRVDRQRVYELVRTHQIPYIKIGTRQYRFLSSAIECWLSNGGSPSKGPHPDARMSGGMERPK